VLRAAAESLTHDLEGPKIKCQGVDTSLLHVVTIRDDSPMCCRYVTLTNKT